MSHFLPKCTKNYEHIQKWSLVEVASVFHWKLPPFPLSWRTSVASVKFRISQKPKIAWQKIQTPLRDFNSSFLSWLQTQRFAHLFQSRVGAPFTNVESYGFPFELWFQMALRSLKPQDGTLPVHLYPPTRDHGLGSFPAIWKSQPATPLWAQDVEWCTISSTHVLTNNLCTSLVVDKLHPCYNHSWNLQSMGQKNLRLCCRRWKWSMFSYQTKI